MDERETCIFIDPEKTCKKTREEILSKCRINLKTGEWYCKGTRIYITRKIMKELIYN